jgi:DNA transformation protein and related proteins
MNSKKNEFKEYVLDQLHRLNGVECKHMFGGFGLYCHAVFFGIIADGSVYFKTNTTTVDAYKEKGMHPFKPSEKQTLKNYYEVPAEILEDDEQLAEWARKAYYVGEKTSE